MVVRDSVTFGDETKGERGDKGEPGEEMHLEGRDAETGRFNKWTLGYGQRRR